MRGVRGVRGVCVWYMCVVCVVCGVMSGGEDLFFSNSWRKMTVWIQLCEE